MAERTKKKLIYSERCHELTLRMKESIFARETFIYLLDYNFWPDSIEVKIRIHYIIRYILKKEAFFIFSISNNIHVQLYILYIHLPL